jgi:methylated-DNA-[protein]-cysteine S-methyltransferase
MRSAPADPHYDAVIAAPFAHLGVVLSADGVQQIAFLPPDYPLRELADRRVQALTEALARYWRDPAQPFGLPLSYRGSPHQLLVWQAMLTIPVGQTRSYGDIARQIGSSPRAVGQACGANPLPILIPCHRVVGKTGRGGFMHRRDSEALSYKDWLLQHESVR